MRMLAFAIAGTLAYLVAVLLPYLGNQLNPLVTTLIIIGATLTFLSILYEKRPPQLSAHRLTAYVVVVVGSIVAPITLPTNQSILLLQVASTLLGIIFLSIFLAGYDFSKLSRAQRDKVKRDREREAEQQRIKEKQVELYGTVCRFLDILVILSDNQMSDSKSRAFLFLYDANTKRLQLRATSTNNIFASERKLSFGYLEGFVGDIFWREKSERLLDKTAIADVKFAFKINAPEQIEATKNFNSIWGTPIFSPLSNEIIGVLTVDSVLPLMASPLPKKDFIVPARGIANEIANMAHFLLN